MRKIYRLVGAFALGASLAAIPALRADTPKEDAPKAKPATAAQKQKSMNYLKQIGFAMHNYHDTFNHLPIITDKDGKPLLSWRVALLPQLEEETLYKEFKLDEAWDSDHNKKLLERLPAVYKPVRGKAGKNETFYRVFVGNGGMFDKSEKVTFAHITDGLSNTFMVVEAGEAVPWTKPHDLEYDPKKDVPKLGGMFDGDFHVLLGDGHVRMFHKGKKAESVRRLIVRNDGEIVTEEDWKP